MLALSLLTSKPFYDGNGNGFTPNREKNQIVSQRCTIENIHIIATKISKTFSPNVRFSEVGDGGGEASVGGEGREGRGKEGMREGEVRRREGGGE